ncbi:type II toxin-antitoxin system VapB family antitoxin [Paraburkholderia sp. CNPSo 3076]|uniref:antitoxin n=1 Tax=Paraburkholderia sp. CNPSo 3076 TaxID=2940936 RepID=UPI0022541BD5|nr:type II toxin-antitoxin system VapB family antitoxin [Paraburkholderia sp. CNPSo 3076]MCX5539779.1 type II toxin-antitoxin system VapB family antitoxin [Paraburkholderia sp. CNPSo 3076]
MDLAKIFKHGGSQAVRLPKDFRFETAQVRIRRHGAAVILEPVPQDWAWLTPLIGPIDADFETAATTQPADQARPDLDVFE